ncbi:nitroimidazol reductase NimA-like FMN-containing flavoprotein (pyridoxamine 5'-phosphate oxidase superfamily) [Kitasatospora herbaricolor]|uniref:pyridoxamine 5'-phosphate oxidase family protein n=1 Tax=Kitasatospora herbaricolor TaxID=68217 RepID=UPI00174C82C5|nr:pyridoxamine 5'-phosphate oxidase family protein [Kitasatospora herbaricolor]MDQ0312685.1 nitroimidazol reductase NimA-like FMN-containing flavoprotein (pyridoxamine 5'-phosphate oxidase superfamily) [Kitasatospora herbaricolor]
MKPDRIPSFEHSPLDQRQCLRLLAATRVGRVVYTVGALPAVLPTRYRLDADGSVLLSAAAGSELVRAVSGALVAFEAGEVSESDGSGWSVTVLGRADVSEARPPHEPVLPRLPGQVSIRIRAELVTGRLLPDVGAGRP